MSFSNHLIIPSTSQAGSTTNKRMQPSRSNSAPSLTHWVGTSNGQIKRSWNPSTSPCIPIISIEGKNIIGKLDKGKSKSTEIEQGLSQIYVTHEKQEAEECSYKSMQRRSPIKRTIVLHDGHVAHERRIDTTDDGAITNVEEEGSNIISQTKDAPLSNPKRQSWGSSLFGSAVNVGVFGAALGLTAYRLISNQPSSSTTNERPIPDSMDRDIAIDDGQYSVPFEIHERTEEDLTGPSPKGMSPCIVEASPRDLNLDQVQPNEPHIPVIQNLSSNMNTESLPPPAYEETENKGIVKSLENNKEWEDLDLLEEEQIITPTSSKMSTLKSRSSQYSLSTIRRRNNNRKRKKLLKNELSFDHSSIITSSISSTPIIEIHNLNDNTIDKNLNKSISVNQFEGEEGMNAQNQNNENDDDDDDDDDDEMISRLDFMSCRLSKLIAEGKKALESDVDLGLINENESLISNQNIIEEICPESEPTYKNTKRESKIPIRVSSDLYKQSASTDMNYDHISISREENKIKESKIPIRSQSINKGLNKFV
ncbi:uncharacterized protein I206_106874 [Kwoniella pini CBS 10737]|uniref:Uncharacterized protein n=1 Tax=Kwoniella pini CBS 10737 TaxID=1296096 RepID=A0A1B9HZT5_9TREE|nr:uncharacterized protein I206_05580 [Kwoniella pini CBS 10737]OCF48799.1 hypothetical protein I206_05580 [Kwoniella pini CBS 10737]